MITRLTLDVYSDRSDSSAYRVYVDNDLLTERTWIWPSYETFIREHIEADLHPGSHEVRIVRCQGQGNFEVRKFCINGADVPANNLRFQI